MARETARSSGWWGKFVALLAGVPPIAVQAADDDADHTDDEPGPFARRSER